MFGLMRQRGCGGQAQRQRRRLHYCGTCKTLGARHGQSSRWLLNHDTVFLAELLDALAPAPETHWHPAYAHSSCLKIPSSTQQPLPLRLAAAATVWMAGFKLQDRLEDRGGWHWRWLVWRFQGRFKQAHEELRQLGVAVERISELLASQHQREASAPQVLQSQGAESALTAVATPTAEATALVLSQGMTLVGKPELAPLGTRLGQHFGTLIYLLDAWEDYPEDHRRGAFNALGMLHNYPSVPEASMREAWYTRLWLLADQLVDDLNALPLPATAQASFQHRLRLNLTERLNTTDPGQDRRKTRKKRWSCADGCCDCCSGCDCDCPSGSGSGGGCCDGCNGCSCDCSS